MKLVDLDVVLVLPESRRRQAVACSESLSARMVAAGSSSHFQLGKPFPGTPGKHDGHCEPHVSLFMLTAGETEVPEIAHAVERLAKTLPILPAEGTEYRYNPHGAPELYFTKSTEWKELQRAVVTVIEPLRRHRLRETDPSGSRISDLLDNSREDDPRRQQLLKYGYDEIADESPGGHDCFNPHVTLAWPRDAHVRVPLDDLPPPSVFSGTLDELGLFGMSGYGTCTKNYGIFSLTRR